METKPACVLFSGGADSTLAASIISEQYSPVHLLSFKHHHMSQLEKTTQSAHHLQEHFGAGKILHQWIDMTGLWRKMNCEPPQGSLRLPGLFALLLKPCLACKVAMHLLTLSYCLAREIKVAADGAHPDGAALFPEQLNEGLDVLREFYRLHGIRYENPVYQVKQPDVELFAQGVTRKKNTKNEHIYYSNQFACHVGLLAYFYHYLTWPFDKNKKKTLQYSMDFLARGLREGYIPAPLTPHPNSRPGVRV
jgi:tRNA(Ile)-lysidine synthase TilS/MesJ